MPLATLNSAQLQKLLQLVKQKEMLQSRIDSINAVLVAMEAGQPVSPDSPTGRRSYRRKKARKGSSLKLSITTALRAAGKKGMHIKKLAEATGAKVGSVSVWAYSNPRCVKKVSPGTFALHN